MKLQFRIQDIPDGNPISGLSATLRSLSTGEAIASAMSDSEGFVSFTLNGTPPPCQVQITKGAETRFISSQVEGPAGAFDLSEMERVLQGIGTVSGGVSALLGSALEVTTTGAADLTVSVGTGAAITPDGFLFVSYAPTVLTIPAPTSPATLATFFVVVDGSTAAASLGQTQLKVVTSVATNQTKLADVISRSSSLVIAAADINQEERPLLLEGVRTTQVTRFAETTVDTQVAVTSTTAANVEAAETSVYLASGTWDVQASVLANTNGEVELALWAGNSSSPGTYVASGTFSSQASSVLIESGVSGGASRRYGMNIRRRSGGLAGDYTLTRTTTWVNNTVPLNFPQDICTGGGYYFVSNQDSDHIQIWSTDGSYVKKFGKNGTANGEFRSPKGIATGSGYSVFVVDSGNDRVQHLLRDLTGSLSYSSKFGTSGTSAGQFSSPSGIANFTTSLYVTDISRHKVLKFTTSGAFVLEWGGLGSGTGQFSYPYGVATASGDVLVADYGNDRISRFTSSGTFVSSFATSNPLNVEVDGQGRIWVTSSADDAVRVYSSDGVLLATVTWASYPNGMITNGSGNMVIVNGSTSGGANAGAIGTFTLTGDYALNAATLSVTAVPRR